jgi:hypothetical protein
MPSGSSHPVLARLRTSKRKTAHARRFSIMAAVRFSILSVLWLVAFGTVCSLMVHRYVDGGGNREADVRVLYSTGAAALPWWTLNFESLGHGTVPSYSSFEISSMDAELRMFVGVPILQEHANSTDLTFRVLGFLYDNSSFDHVYQENSKKLSVLRLTCSLIWDQLGGGESAPVEAHLYISDNNIEPFTIDCPLPESLSRALLHPELTQNLKSPPGTPFLKLGASKLGHGPVKLEEKVFALKHDSGRLSPKGQVKLAACVGAIVHGVHPLLWTEFLEYHIRIVGIEHFYVYYTDDHANIEAIRGIFQVSKET